MQSRDQKGTFRSRSWQLSPSSHHPTRSLTSAPTLHQHPRTSSSSTTAAAAAAILCLTISNSDCRPEQSRSLLGAPACIACATPTQIDRIVQAQAAASHRTRADNYHHDGQASTHPAGTLPATPDTAVLATPRFPSRSPRFELHRWCRRFHALVGRKERG